MFHVSCLGIWWQYDISVPGKLKSWNLIISRTKGAFDVKSEIFFLVLQMVSFRHKRQTSKNVADTIFKLLRQNMEIYCR